MDCRPTQSRMQRKPFGVISAAFVAPVLIDTKVFKATTPHRMIFCIRTYMASNSIQTPLSLAISRRLGCVPVPPVVPKGGADDAWLFAASAVLWITASPWWCSGRASACIQLEWNLFNIANFKNVIL
jgi:hypothetical protein